MFMFIVLIVMFITALAVLRHTRGRSRISRLILWFIAAAWSPERIERQAAQRRSHYRR